MKTLLALAALSLALVPAAHATPDVTVLVKVSAGSYLAPGELCPVRVPAGSDGGVVLDAAVAAGCLTSWSATDYGTFGRFVDCVDGVCANGDLGGQGLYADGAYWELSYGALHTAECGIDCYHATDMDVFGVTYQDWYASLVDYTVSTALP